LKRAEATTSETILIVGICFGWAIVVSTLIALSGFESRGFSDGRLVGSIVTELAIGAVAVLILHWRGYNIATLYPAPSISGVLWGTALYVAAAIVSTVLAGWAGGFASWDPAERMMQAAHPSLAVIVPAAIVNGSYEEIFLLGFLMRALRRHGTSIALGLPVLIRLLYHTYQGPLGTVAMLGYGVVVGLFYLRTSALFPAVFCHILGDIIPFMMAGTSG
jgi:membrane protease YdiL (CAAX protease family)